MLPSKPIRLGLLAVISFATIFVPPLGAGEKSGRKPNVVVIVADDE